MIAGMPIVPRYGDVITLNDDAFFSKIQHVSTQRWINGVSPKKFGPGNRSHSTLCAGVVCGEVSLFEAKEKVVIDPWAWSQFIPHRIYRFKAPDAVIATMMHSVYIKDADQWYSFLWLPYFPFRKIVELTLHLDVRRMRPWFPGGVICSEEVYLAFLSMATLMGWQDMIDYLNQWNGNNFHSSDTQSVLDTFCPKYLDLIDSYKLDT